MKMDEATFDSCVVFMPPCLLRKRDLTARICLSRLCFAVGPKEAVARARCIVAEAEIALASRDLGWPAKMLDAARSTLEAHGDRLNAGFARYLEVRRLLLIGHLDEVSEHTFRLRRGREKTWIEWTFHAFVVEGVAIRRLRTNPAHAALARAEHAAHQPGIPT